MGSELHRLKRAQMTLGTLEAPRFPERHLRSDGCQLGLVFRGVNEPKSLGKPMQKGQLWSSTFDLSRLSLRCRNASALKPTTHEHRVVRGSHKIETEQGLRWESVAKVSGAYTDVCGDLYGLFVKDLLSHATRDDKERPSVLCQFADEHRKQTVFAQSAGPRDPSAVVSKPGDPGPFPDQSSLDGIQVLIA